MMPHYKTYLVTWTIDIYASSPEVAAAIARDIQLDPDNIATVFEVTCEGRSVQIDLLEGAA